MQIIVENSFFVLALPILLAVALVWIVKWYLQSMDQEEIDREQYAELRAIAEKSHNARYFLSDYLTTNRQIANENFLQVKQALRQLVLNDIKQEILDKE